MREPEREPATGTATLAAELSASPALTAESALAIVGAGRVGGSLAAAAVASGVPTRLAGRADAVEACRASEVALLCVPDEAIAETAATLAAADPGLRLVGHSSGSTALTALAPLVESGAAAFSLHPLQTVPDRDTDLSGCPAAIAGSTPEALGYARELAVQLRMQPFEVAEEDRAAYHAAASIASNFLVALEQSAAELLSSVGVADARKLLTPLVLRTAANWSEHGAAALTGPIARGDEVTVARHLQALRETAPELSELYEVLAGRTRALADRGSPSAAGQR